MTNIIKGIALIMMFVHHFFTFPDWWLDGIDYPMVAGFAHILRAPLKLCVPIFCFLSGYFYFFAPRKTFSYSVRKITDILISYWAVFIPLAIFAVFFAGVHYTAVGFVRELLALAFPTMIFCWYVYFYYVFMLFLPIFSKILSNRWYVDFSVSLLILPLMFHSLQYVCSYRFELLRAFLGVMGTWFPNVAIGYLFAKYGIFSKLDSFLSNYFKGKCSHICILFSFFLFPLGRYIEPGVSIIFDPMPIIHKSVRFYLSLDFVYAPFFIYAIIELFKNNRLPVLRNILLIIGKYSLPMWFIHCIFFANCRMIFQPILYFPKNPILVTIWGLLFCLTLAIPINHLTEWLNRCKNKILFS